MRDQVLTKSVDGKKIAPTNPETAVWFLTMCMFSDDPSIVTKAYATLTRFRVLESGQVTPAHTAAVEKNYLDSFAFLTAQFGMTEPP